MPAPSSVNAERLLRAMAEELKAPLLQIARQAEYTQKQPDVAMLRDIELSANQALWFVDSYLLSQQLLDQAVLELEPVSVSAVLHDVTQALADVAKQYNCQLELQLSGRYGPVMAHAHGLKTALIGLGHTLIAAGEQYDRPHRLVLGAHKTRDGGIVAGVFSQTDGLSQAVYRRGRELYGKARQPFNEFSTQGGTGVFVAEALFASMESELRVATHNKITGLAATLQPSRQLLLV